jgi:transposase, IS30 family
MCCCCTSRRQGRVDAAMRTAIATLPGELSAASPWNQGRETSGHATFRVDTAIAGYLRDPHSPWQRGSTENTNGRLRQYRPKAPT